MREKGRLSGKGELGGRKESGPIHPELSERLKTITISGITEGKIFPKGSSQQHKKKEKKKETNIKKEALLNWCQRPQKVTSSEDESVWEKDSWPAKAG